MGHEINFKAFDWPQNMFYCYPSKIHGPLRRHSRPVLKKSYLFYEAENVATLYCDNNYNL